MDGIKLHIKNECDIDTLNHLTRIYSKMSSRREKCRWMVSRRGKMITADGVRLPERNVTDVQDSCRYLGRHGEAAQRSTRYLQMVRQVLNGQLNSLLQPYQ